MIITFKKFNMAAAHKVEHDIKQETNYPEINTSSWSEGY